LLHEQDAVPISVIGEVNTLPGQPFLELMTKHKAINSCNINYKYCIKYMMLYAR
jgi:hypothetical protein